jgi:hypothetical protein
MFSADGSSGMRPLPSGWSGLSGTVSGPRSLEPPLGGESGGVSVSPGALVCGPAGSEAGADSSEEGGVDSSEEGGCDDGGLALLDDSDGLLLELGDVDDGGGDSELSEGLGFGIGGGGTRLSCCPSSPTLRSIHVLSVMFTMTMFVMTSGAGVTTTTCVGR